MIAVVIPCYRVTAHIRALLDGLGAEVSTIYCVDDACPDGSGDYIESVTRDPRVRVLRNSKNQGVGGATMVGLKQAIDDDADIIVKMDGDGQMNPADLPRLIQPIVAGDSDFAKGNRFFHLEDVSLMPISRLAGNAVLSFLTKISSGYWNIFDPTNGYIAVHAAVARELPMDKISRGYFFESDLLFRLNVMGAVVADVPMQAHYGEETSHLRIGRVILPFVVGNLKNFLKRFVYSYLLRDFNVATIQTVLGLGLIVGGATFGIWHWIGAYADGAVTPAGTVMVAALPIILGLQLLLAAINYDLLSVPRTPLHPRLEVADHRVGRQNSKQRDGRRDKNERNDAPEHGAAGIGGDSGP